MSDNHQVTPRRRPRRSSEAISLVLVMAAVVALAGIFVADRLSDSSSGDAKTVSAGAGIGEAAGGAGATTAPGVTAAPGAAPAADPASTDGPELDEEAAAPADGACTMTVKSLQMGASGPSVVCLQKALAAAGLFNGAVNGEYGGDTYAAVRQAQEKRDLFVDGNVGRETAISLGIWPDEASLVKHTPPPTPGAVDSMGFRLSSVASTGAGAPPLPDNSGSGRRLVYDRGGQRVWAVGKNGEIIRSWLVSGSKFNNEVPGTHEVYSKSEVSTAWNGKAYLPKMVRYYKTDIGAIGFHAIPLHVADRSPYQTDAELGTRLSGGCQRQANLDAAFTWVFAQIGTKVVVV